MSVVNKQREDTKRKSKPLHNPSVFLQPHQLRHTLKGNWVAVRTYGLIQTRIQSSALREGCRMTAQRPILAPPRSTWCSRQSSPAGESHVAPSYSTSKVAYGQNGVTVVVVIAGWGKREARWWVRTPLMNKAPEEGGALRQARVWWRDPVAVPYSA